MGDEEVGDLGLHAETRQRFCHDDAVRRQALVRQITEQRRECAVGEDFRQHRCDQFVFTGRWRHVQGEVDIGWRRSLGAGRRSPSLDEGAAADLAGDQATRFGFRIGPRYRADTEPELVGHVALGQEPRTRLEDAALDIVFQRLDEGEIARPLDVRENGKPIPAFRNLRHALSLQLLSPRIVQFID